jgi:hypothetical protein
VTTLSSPYGATVTKQLDDSRSSSRTPGLRQVSAASVVGSIRQDCRQKPSQPSCVYPFIRTQRTAAAARSWRPYVLNNRSRCVLTVRGDIPSCRAISLSGSPDAIRSRISDWRAVTRKAGVPWTGSVRTIATRLAIEVHVARRDHP